MPTDLEAVADDLYRLLPAEFVAARDAKAGEARAAGNRSLATEIKALRRPTQGAWMVNWLARERAADLGRLLELGTALRAAQDRLAGEELRKLSRQRHAVVAALAGDARRAAAEAGRPASDAAGREVEETLSAALADEQAAAAVRAGHLSTAIHCSGFGSDSADEASLRTAASGASPERETSPRGGGRDGGAEATGERQRQLEAERNRRLEEADAAFRAAQAAAADAHRTADDRVRQVDDARRQLEQLRESIRDLEARLDGLRNQESDAAHQLRGAEQARERADRLAADTDARAAAARARVQDLREQDVARQAGS